MPMLFSPQFSEPNQGPCDSNPCQHGGTCSESDPGTDNEKYTCNCDNTGHTGTNCETRKELNIYRPHSGGMGKVMFSQASVRSHFRGVPPSAPSFLTERVSILPDIGYPHPSQWGYPHPRSGMGGGTPILDLDHRVPPSKVRTGGILGYSPPPTHPGQVPGQHGATPNWNSTVCTYYAAGGMSLAFTQEDFLVVTVFWKKPIKDYLTLSLGIRLTVILSQNAKVYTCQSCQCNSVFHCLRWIYSCYLKSRNQITATFLIFTCSCHGLWCHTMQKQWSMFHQWPSDWRQWFLLQM